MWTHAMQSDPDRNVQFRRLWGEPELRTKPPPDADARQRPPLPQGGTPIANTKPREALNIAPQRGSRTAEKHTGGSGRSKSSPRHKRRQPNVERIVKIARRFPDPRGRP